jgi:Uma2 family endonuclease
MTTINTHSFTPDDVLRLESQGELYELVAGQLVEKPMSELANETAVYISSLLFTYAKPRDLGRVLAEQTFRCFPNDPDQIRRPDVAFISADRASEERSAGPIPFPPDLAVEVISPNDKAYDLDEKLNDYRQARIKLVWVVNPELRTVVIERGDGSITRLTESETITGESVLPGFAAKVAELFPRVAEKSK